jgi:hypothetical protein
MQIDFYPFGNQGSQYVIAGARRDALAVMTARGIDELDAIQRLEAVYLKAKRTGEKQPVQLPLQRRRDADSDVVVAFIHGRYTVDAAERVTFANFYDTFQRSLSPIERQLWSKKRVSRALPAEHPSVAGSANVRYVLGLAEAA